MNVADHSNGSGRPTRYYRGRSNLAGLSHKFDEFECARVRKELGYPIMITPFSQFVGIQAVLNVVHGERYCHVPDEVKKYALGYYGKLHFRRVAEQEDKPERSFSEKSQ